MSYGKDLPRTISEFFFLLGLLWYQMLYLGQEAAEQQGYFG